MARSSALAPRPPRNPYATTALWIGASLAGGLATFLVLRKLYPPVSAQPIPGTAPSPPDASPNTPNVLQAVGPYGLEPPTPAVDNSGSTTPTTPTTSA